MYRNGGGKRGLLHCIRERERGTGWGVGAISCSHLFE
jgi:hypothetical protein